MNITLNFFFSLFLFGVATYLVTSIYQDIRNGKVTLTLDPKNNFQYERSENPPKFWGVVGIYALGISMLIGVGVFLLTFDPLIA
ncbi:MAG: hypothetical protein AAGD96_03180 [Chloroflexota bacterium]